MKRPVIQQLVQTVMAKAASAQQLTDEAARQLQSKTASERSSALEDSVSTEYVLKLAGAIDYIIPQMKEAAATHNADPAVLPPGVTATDLPSSNPLKPNNTGHGLQEHMPPHNPPTERAPLGGATNQLKTDEKNPPAGGIKAVQHTSLQAMKSAPKTAEEAVTQSLPEDGKSDRAETMLGRAIESKRVEKSAAEALLEKNLQRAKQAGAVSNAVETLGQKAIGGAYKGLGALGSKVTSESGKNMLGAAYKAVDKVAPHAGKVGAGLVGVGAVGAAGALRGKQKEASIESLAEELLKTVKEAEDAINPARISAPKHTPLTTDEDGTNFGVRPRVRWNVLLLPRLLSKRLRVIR